MNRAERTRLLAAFDRSGLSAAAVARRHNLHYTTFCGWRHRRAKATSSPALVEVELAEQVKPVALCIELGPQARLHLRSFDQIELAVALLQRLHAPASC